MTSPSHKAKIEKPREFWISNDRDDDSPYSTLAEYEDHRKTVREQYPGLEEKCGPLEAVHVIEHKAYASALDDIRLLVQEMRFAMKYYESCGDEAEPEYQCYKSFEKTLAAIQEKYPEMKNEA